MIEVLRIDLLNLRITYPSPGISYPSRDDAVKEGRAKINSYISLIVSGFDTLFDESEKFASYCQKISIKLSFFCGFFDFVFRHRPREFTKYNRVQSAQQHLLKKCPSSLRAIEAFRHKESGFFFGMFSKSCAK